MTAHPKIDPETDRDEPLRLMYKGMPMSAELDNVPIIGVLPRYASTNSEIQWFEAPGFNAMHAINAWKERDQEIILVAPNAISIENLFHNIESVKKAIWGWMLWREPMFVAKDGAREEDEGYIASYVYDENSGVSRFVVMNAKSQTLDVVAAVKLPRIVPYGFHGLFVKMGILIKRVDRVLLVSSSSSFLL
ncbi:hypothetical protein AAG906_007621 [Vitis piasezkii]